MTDAMEMSRRILIYVEPLDFVGTKKLQNIKNGCVLRKQKY